MPPDEGRPIRDVDSRMRERSFRRLLRSGRIRGYRGGRVDEPENITDRRGRGGRGERVSYLDRGSRGGRGRAGERGGLVEDSGRGRGNYERRAPFRGE